MAACLASCISPATAPAAALSNAPDQPGYTLGGPAPQVHAILRVGDTIYIGGDFTSVNGQPRTNLAAISAADGSLTSWAPTTDNEVDALAASGSTIYAGGQFTLASGVARNGAAAFDSAGNLLAWNPAPSTADVLALLVDGSQIYLGGSFASTGAGAVPTTNLARVDAVSGVPDASWQPNPDNTVNGLVSDGTFVYPIGSFANAGGAARNGLAAISIASGTADAAWNPSDPVNGGSINAIAISPDRSTIYVTGDFFATYGGGGACPPQCSMGYADRSKAAGLEPAGSGRTGVATAWDPNPDIEGDALAATSSAVYFGDTSAVTLEWTTSAITRNYLAALDPVTGAPQAWDPSANNAVYSLVASADGSVYAGGDFTALAQPPGAVGFASFSLPPANVTAPSLTGSAQPGQTLTCGDGSWSGAAPQSYSSQFLRDGQPVGGAGASTYTLTDADAGHALSCRVTAQNRVTSVSADSAPVTVAALPVTPPVVPAAPAAVPPPVLFKSVDLIPVSGAVRVKLPGSKRFIPVQDATNVPVGTIVDVTHGVVQLVAAANARGGTERGTFYGGMFKIVQLRGKPPITELVLVGGNFKRCKAHAAELALAASATSKRVIRHLWGQAKGAFRTKGRYASATIRGTKWLTADRCDGTLVLVAKGAVTVRDLVRRKSLVVRAGHRYLALAPRRHR